jgi:hypothetical protein
MAKWIWRSLAAAVLGIYFFRLTRGSLHVALSPDDITNIYRAYSWPLTWLFRANLLFFETSPFYRPFASAWYRVIFHFAGINPLPYHVINLLILVANGFLTYAVARRLSGSRETGWLTTLLACYHTQFNALYFDTGFVFDVLCYFFYFAAFLYYLRIRQDGRFPGAWALVVVCALYVCALNSKELALTLPLFLALYECVYHGLGGRRWLRWLRNEGRGALATGTLTLVFLIGRATGEFTLMRNTAYQPSFTWDRFMLTSRTFLGDLFFRPDRVTTTHVLLLWAALAAVAWASRSKTLRFAWLFLMLSVAPVAFVEPRGAAQYYVPLFGWALYAAAVLTGLTRWIFSPLPDAVARWRAPALMAAVLLMLYPFYKAKGHDNVTSVTVDGMMLQSLCAQTLALHPVLPMGSHFLLLNDTDDPAWDTFLAALRLSYRDDMLVVDRARKMDHKVSEKDVARYDVVLDYREGRLTDMYGPADPRLKPVVMEIYHLDFSPVNAGSPVRRGESLIVKMSGLGATDPDVPVGSSFPADPLAAVIHRVAARLNGMRAETMNAIGWPQTVGMYRVDVHVPDVIKPGAATLEFWVRGVASPAVQFQVR